MAEQTHTVEIDGLHVQVEVGHHADGTPYIELVPSDDCRLEGDSPGFYYVVPDNA